MDKQQIIDLWRLSFGDPEGFIRLYFDRVYKEENTLVIERNGRVLSALQMLPYTMTYAGTEVSVAYLCGLCTLPSERGKGLMKELMEKAYQVMKERGIAVAALIPASPRLAEYYRKQGYTPTFGYTSDLYVKPDQPVQEPELTVLPPEVLSIEQLYSYFDRMLRKRPRCMLHTPDDFVTILRDLALGNGQLLTAINQKEEAVGMAFVLPPERLAELSGEHYPLVTELLFDDERIKNLLLQEICLQQSTVAVRYYSPASTSGVSSLGMARVIDTHRMIRLWETAHPHSSLTIREIEDMPLDALNEHLLTEYKIPAWMSLMLN